MTDLLWNHPKDPPVAQLLLAHGAGAPMDSGFMSSLAQELSGQGLRVARFEFAYMAARREGKAKRPPAPMPHLLADFAAAVASMPTDVPLWVGGKSMGGRMATWLAREPAMAGRLSGVVCYGYPFHPVGKPASLRIEHLGSLPVPLLICQGERDAFGTREQVSGYGLPESIQLCWLPDGNHDLVPRKASGVCPEDNLRTAAEATCRFIKGAASAPAIGVEATVS